MLDVTATGWQVLGKVAIDSATIALVDPANEDLLEAYWKTLEDNPGESDELVHGLGPRGSLGVIVSTGMGDGLYPVEGRIEQVDGTPRVAEIKIKFLPY